MLLGNHAGASGGYPLESFEAAATIFSDDLDEGEADRRATAEAVGFVRDHPLQWLAILPRKLGHLVLDPELSAAQWVFADGSHSPFAKYGAYIASAGAYIGLLLAFAATAITDRRPSASARGPSCGYAVGLIGVCIVLALFGQDRYREPVVPWMLFQAVAMLLVRQRPLG